MSSAEHGPEGPDAWADDAALSRLHRALAREDTPADLDATVLAAARRRGRSGPRLVAGASGAEAAGGEADLSALHAALHTADTDPAFDEAMIARAQSRQPQAAAGERREDEALARLHRAYASEDTPPELDRKVLGLAAQRGRRPRLFERLRGYRAPLALAALLVLGLAVGQMAGLFLAEQPGPRVDLLGGGGQRAPESWLEDIRALVRAHRVDEAKQELERFSGRYPDHPIPEDLAPLRAGKYP